MPCQVRLRSLLLHPLNTASPSKPASPQLSIRCVECVRSECRRLRQLTFPFQPQQRGGCSVWLPCISLFGFGCVLAHLWLGSGSVTFNLHALRRSVVVILGRLFSHLLACRATSFVLILVCVLSAAAAAAAATTRLVPFPEDCPVPLVAIDGQHCTLKKSIGHLRGRFVLDSCLLDNCLKNWSCIGVLDTGHDEG